jgi:hypothetical protein
MSSVYGGGAIHRLTPQIEIKEENQSFNGSTASGTSANFVTGIPVDGWVDISGLQSGKSYKLRARVKDEDLDVGVASYWTDFNNSQKAFTVDYTPPTVSLTSPSSNLFYRGIISVSASAGDNLGISKVTYFFNSLGNPVLESLSSPWSFNTAGQNGSGTLYATATDVASTTTTSQVTFKIDNYKPKTLAPKKATVKRNKKTKLYYKVIDPYTGGKANIAIKIFKSTKVKKGKKTKIVWKQVKAIKVGWKQTGKLLTYQFKASIKAGKYKYKIYATDKAGNTQFNTASNTLIVK